MSSRQIPDLERTLSLTDLVAYAGATWDWHRMHYDTAFTEAKGFAAPVVDGQEFGALLAAQLQDAFGPTWRLTSMHFRFRELVFAGDRIRCESVVVSETETTAEVNCTVFATSPDGVERTAVAPAGARLERVS